MFKFLFKNKYEVIDIKDLEKSIELEDKKEAYKRYDAVEKEIDPDQITLYDIYYTPYRTHSQYIIYKNYKQKIKSHPGLLPGWDLLFCPYDCCFNLSFLFS